MSKEIIDKLDKLITNGHNIDKRLSVIEVKLIGDEEDMKEIKPVVRKLELKVYGTQIAFGLIISLLGLFIAISKFI